MKYTFQQEMLIGELDKSIIALSKRKLKILKELDDIKYSVAPEGRKKGSTHFLKAWRQCRERKGLTLGCAFQRGTAKQQPSTPRGDANCCWAFSCDSSVGLRSAAAVPFEVLPIVLSLSLSFLCSVVPMPSKTELSFYFFLRGLSF